MKNIFVILLFILPFSESVFGQVTPQEFSKEFVNGFMNYNEGKLKKLISSDSIEQAKMLKKLKEIYTSDLKPLAGYLLSSSTRAVLKNGDEEHKEIADIFITISDSQKINYELHLWGCYVKDGRWVLGNKIELKKL